jgi:RHS repeat-associated protein
VGRLESIKDWLEHTTSFSYDPDSNLTATTFPSTTKETDHYTYNEADQQTEIKMSKEAETLASLLYTRDKAGQVTQTVTKGLPSEETVEDTYDENERLANSGGTTYEYDAADNPTKIGATTNTFNSGDQLTKAGTTTISYDEVGERTKTTPGTGPATTYAYDQAGDMTSVSRPEEGEVPKIEDTYAYNGDGQRTSRTTGAKMTYITLDTSTPLPTTLTDGTNNYIYGPAGAPIEQIDSEGKVLYLHHDQQTSTRLLTGTTGTVEGTLTYDAYGNQTESTGTATTPLGYDAQYTNTDTGLIYLRARSYDTSTAQFISVDPIKAITQAPYTYVGDNPLNEVDPSGLIFGIPGTPSTNEVVTTMTQAAGGVATAASVVAAGCSVVAAPTVVGEAVCGVVGSGALAAGAVATAGDTYLAATGAQSAGPAVFDALGLGAGIGGEALARTFADGELGAYAKTYAFLFSIAAYGDAFGEAAFGCD